MTTIGEYFIDPSNQEKIWKAMHQLQVLKSVLLTNDKLESIFKMIIEKTYDIYRDIPYTKQMLSYINQQAISSISQYIRSLANPSIPVSVEYNPVEPPTPPPSPFKDPVKYKPELVEQHNQDRNLEVLLQRINEKLDKILENQQK